MTRRREPRRQEANEGTPKAAPAHVPDGARGFSLIELMVVVALIGIMAAVAQSSLGESISKTRANGAVHSLAAFLGRARIVAQKSHKRVQVDTSTANQVALRSCPARYGTNACVTSTTFEPEVQGSIRFGTEVESQGIVLTPPATTLTFDAAGFPEAVATYTFTLSHTSSGTVRMVTVTAAGEIRVE